MKFRWIRYIAERLPKEIRERRKTEIEACFTGTKKQLEEKVMESLYEQVKIVVVATAIFLMILLLTIVMYLSQDRRILITRDETGGETTEKQIRIKTKKDDDIYSLTIRPKGYTKSQITDALDRGEKYLKEHLVAKNKSINEVSKHLEMPSKIQGENITVQWQSDDPAVIDEEGNVFSKNVKKDYIVNLNARMECQGEVRILKIPVCVVPGNSGKRVSEKQKIIADLKKLEEKYITKEQFYLPDVIRQGRLLPAEYEKEQMRGNKGKIFVYEQMKKTCREISFGVPQTKAFADMGQKIGVPSYQKLSVLLVQSITRGSTDLFFRLKEEEEEAFFQRKEQAKRKGEEASTKLLAPMMIMLVVILILLMFPALSQFS